MSSMSDLDGIEQLLHRLLENMAPRRVTHQRLQELLRLLRRDVRWQRRHFRIGVKLEYGRAIRLQRGIPRGADALRLFDLHAFEAERLRVLGVTEIGKDLRVVEL